MLVSILDKHEFQDGRVVLYRRGDIHDNSKYTARLRVPNTSGYVIRSTGTGDLFKARRFAEELYDRLRLKIINGESLREHPFDKCIEGYEKHLDTHVFRTEKDRKEVKAYFGNYPIKFFGSKPLAQIGDEEVLSFIDWRMKNSIRKKTVQANSVRAELNTLRKFFEWARRNKMILSVPEIKKPKAAKTRRPHFDPNDWSQLTRCLPEFLSHKNKSVGRDRLMLANYVLILVNTGIRIGEARNLKWRDISEISPIEGSNESANIVLYVRGKTGAREVVSRTPDIKKYFASILDLRRDELEGKEPGVDSLVFCHPNGKPVQSFKKAFNTLLALAKVERDTHGLRHTLYSLRHTYATYRLMEGVHQFTLARNMGTSVAMLENFYGHASNIASAKELTKNSGYNSIAKTRSLRWIEN